MKKILLAALVFLVVAGLFAAQFVQAADPQNGDSATAGASQTAEISPMAPASLGIEELANRIIFNTPMSFDRRGEIVWADNFEDNIAKWSYTATGTGGSAALSTEAARNGGKSGKLITGNTAGGANSLSRYSPMLTQGKLGTEVSFSIGTNVRYFQLSSVPQLGGKAYYALVRYWPQSDLLQYYDENAAWQTLASVDLYEHLTAFHTLKLVIDLETGRYVRSMLNEMSFDMSAYTIRTAAVGGAAWLVYIGISPDDALNRVVYIDDFIMTMNEP